MWLEFGILLTFLAWVAAKLMCPAAMTGVPQNKDHHSLSVPTEASRYILGSTQSPLCPDSFVASLGGLEKRAGKGE